MNRYMKLLISVGLLFLLIGTAYAVDISDFKLPTNFKVESEYWASNGDFGISVYKYDDSDYTEFFTNNSDNTVYIDKGIANYTWDSGVGCDEVVVIDGEKYLIETFYSTNDMSKIQECYDNLLKFNELNDLTPIEL